jgi:nucleotide-binding universal stress UspA family protein
VIVPLDGSPLAEKALPHGAAVAKGLGAKLVLTRVIPGNGTGQDLTLEQAARAYLESHVKTIEEQGIRNVATRIAYGEPADVLSEILESDDDNLMVMASEGRSGIGRLALGSVADRVIRASGSPVLVVRPRHKWRSGLYDRLTALRGRGFRTP